MEVTGAVCLSVRVAAAQQVKRVALLRDGKVLSWQPVHERVAELDLADDPPGKHWYSVTAEGDSAGLKGPVVAHASPFFVTV